MPADLKPHPPPKGWVHQTEGQPCRQLRKGIEPFLHLKHYPYPNPTKITQTQTLHSKTQHTRKHKNKTQNSRKKTARLQQKAGTAEASRGGKDEGRTSAGKGGRSTGGGQSRPKTEKPWLMSAAQRISSKEVRSSSRRTKINAPRKEVGLF